MVEAISADEYAVYTAVCKTSHFRFSLDGTTFYDYTRVSPTFHGFEDRWSAPFTGKAKYLCAQHPEILEDFARKNAERTRLEKQFEVKNGYKMLSERSPDDHSRCFIFSRVGFSADGVSALVYIECDGWGGYHLLFERAGQEWYEVQCQLAWVS